MKFYRAISFVLDIDIYTFYIMIWNTCDMDFVFMIWFTDSKSCKKELLTLICKISSDIQALILHVFYKSSDFQGIVVLVPFS